MSLGKSDPPPAPDYAAAARAQGGANLQSTIASNVLNRPNEQTPLGSRNWTNYGSYTVPAAEGNPAVQVPLWRSQINLTPEGQSRFEQEQRITGQLGDVAESGLSRVGGGMGEPFDMSQVRGRGELGGMPQLPGQAGSPDITQVPGMNQVGDALYRQQTRYMDPQFQQQESGLENKLVNQGLQRGTEAFDTAMRNFGSDRERAYADARDRAILAQGQEQSRQFGLGAQQFQQGLARGAQDFGQGAQRFGMGLAGQAQQFGLGQQGRQQDISEQAYLRGLPLNELNALRTGAPVQMPQFQPFSTANMQPAPLFNATMAQGQSDMNQYNAGQAQDAAFTQGLFSLGGAALGSPWWLRAGAGAGAGAGMYGGGFG